MLSLSKEKYYVIFNDKSGKSAYGGSGLGKKRTIISFLFSL